ncbi:diphosphomevalonate decarboxylase [Aphelenchoides avenae]|nr:diphosphomevalonate decarboxylase [Aphelenchus avenae]
MEEARPTRKVQVHVPINIALIKYWGKKDEEQMLPLNDSISVTINELYAKTTIQLGLFPDDEVTINGKLQKIGSRFQRVFETARSMLRRDKPEGSVHGKLRFKVSSATNHPVAAGLASSASGFAAIAYALSRILDLPVQETVRLARLGSGSACRSIFSGFVHWKVLSEPEESICESIVDNTHWPELRSVIIVINACEKKVGSSDGMQRTATTSTLMKTRLEEVVPCRVQRLREAIRNKDFVSLAEVTMMESNQLHAVCLDAYPPLHYLNDSSFRLIDFVHDFNDHFGIRLAYTFDAGPNSCLFLEQHSLSLLLQALQRSFVFDHRLLPELGHHGVPDSLKHLAEIRLLDSFRRDCPSATLEISKIVVSELGSGPQLLQKDF